ncbi:PAS domain-containing hybrid sensor histidine kinase/response regulator [Desulfoplanes sp.]
MTSLPDHHRFIYDSLPDPTFVTDYQGGIIALNRAAQSFTGLDQEEVEGRNLSRILHFAGPKRAEDIDSALCLTLTNGSPHSLQEPVCMLSAVETIRWMRITVAPLLDADMHIFALIVTLTDVTGEYQRIASLEKDPSHSKSTDQALQASEQRLWMSLHINRASVFEDNFETGEMDCSPELFNQLGYPQEEHPTTIDGMLELIHPDDQNRVMAEVARHITGKTPMYVAEYRVRSKNGTWEWCDAKGRITERTKEGSPRILLGISSIITDRKLKEERIRENEEKLRLAVDNSPIGICIIDDTGRYLSANQAYQDLLGYSEAEFKQKTFFEVTSPEHLEENRTLFDAMVVGKAPGYKIEKQYLHKDGTPIDVSVHATMARDKHGAPRFALALVEDITKRKRAERILRDNEEQLRTTIDSIGEGVISTDREGMITRMNHAAAKLTGWTPGVDTVHFTQTLNLPDPEDATFARNLPTAIRNRGDTVESTRKMTLIARDGHNHLITLSAAPIRNQEGRAGGMVLVFRDVTERVRIEDELEKMQRLESIGTLAGGIAHDFNNVLMGIYGNISIARQRLPKGHPALSPLMQSETSINRATRLSTQLLTFARGGEPIKQTVELDKLVEDIVRFDLSGSNVRPVFTIPEGTWAANVDKGQMQQVFSNLTINAREAMPEGGELHVGFETICPTNGPTTDQGPDQCIRITVQDEGTGIPAKFIKRIFDPYFSTKKTGSGLGLATTYSIINKHDGKIDVQSTPGQGTLFTILLPASPVQVATDSSPYIQAQTAHPSTARILIMDDEEMIREVMTESFEDAGFYVGTAKDGHEAIEKYERALQGNHPFDLLIMDLTIPGGMGGKETIEAILALDPKAKAIVSSGYAGDPVMANYARYGFKAVAVKPYPMDKLLETVRRVLADNHA